MARKVDTTKYTTFGAITERLDEIVTQVRKNDLSLESSLDLFDEAIALGSKAVDFVDTAPITAEEAMQAHQAEGEDASSNDAASTPAEVVATSPEHA